ncbi:sugar phosphate isomerase/epimerase family protein [Actinophytocola oryzae]|uniref:Sugar phosphate isomerase/epimerase n=1 Tax=Actinophytocola oryzae TaxID=502181 RepID=A0A4R7UUQ0_9PSEU|nr:TIM barrel protein [Actinophytocola oryzae]TDV39727.1 sugar phosphate isomerase/epimerase [Actinophytocola oryzae]
MSTTSVQLYSVREAFAEDPADTLARLAGIGFTQVEPFGLAEHAEILRTALPEHGLTAPTAHAKLVGTDQDAVFAAAVACGVGVVIDPYVPPEQWENEADVAATATALNAAAKKAADLGLAVGYHNHWWELQNSFGGRSALEVFAELLDPELVLEVDTYWAAAGGADAPALLDRLGDRVIALHVKDGDLATDASGQVPAGQGRVPVADVLAASPDALRVIEFDAYDGDMFEGLATSYAYVTGAAR